MENNDKTTILASGVAAGILAMAKVLTAPILPVHGSIPAFLPAYLTLTVCLRWLLLPPGPAMLRATAGSHWADRG